MRTRTWRQRLTSVQFAAFAGIVCAICWSLGLRGLLRLPGLHDTREEIAAFYAQPGSHSVETALALVVIGTVAYLWFVGVVRSRLGQHDARMEASVFLGGSILLTGLLMVGASALAAPAILAGYGAQAPDPGAVGVIRALAGVELAVFAPRVVTLVMFSTASLGRRSGALPGWLVVLTLVLGVFEFVTVTLSEPTLFVFPAWIALVSVVFLLRHPGGAAQAGDDRSATQTTASS